MSKKFILILYGPQCSGKSSVAKLILKKTADIFHVHFDKIKWLISDYSAEKYSNTGIVNRLALSLAKQAAVEGFSILVEGNAQLAAEIDEYHKIAEANNQRLIQVNIEAPYETLLDRFNVRVKDAEAKKTKISVTTEKGMKERYDKYYKLKNNQIPTFDSSVMSPEEILSEIEKCYNV